MRPEVEGSNGHGICARVEEREMDSATWNVRGSK